MTAIILVWNPDEWNDWTYPAVLEEVAETGRHLASWGVGTGLGSGPGSAAGTDAAGAASSGADAWLVLQGRHGCGLIGHGVIVSERPAPRVQAPDSASAAQPGTQPGAQDASALCIQVDFDALLPAGDQIPPGVLAEAVPGIDWEALHGPAMAVDSAVEPLLRGLWGEFGPVPADPTQPVPGTVPAAAVTRVEVIKYEHSPDARRVCVAHHGTSCAACGFSFEIAYGEIGKDFIPVHHLVPVSQLGSRYELDPVTDLVPLCANCHAMAHHGVRTPRSVAELRRIMAAAGFLTGQSVTPEQLQAQQDARRILEQH
ncbi:HNH endonuclease [Arthrobacter sp. 131MFCol6.1]|uniref:HNH endonuclease n=1 Tax=Arthrobacter sp. 131MFCol6.1 TaxID=1157944 RepID=UPI00035E3116|nr:HNH endonuclease [Arthrobacter sp. 131MFCol6.1]